MKAPKSLKKAFALALAVATMSGAATVFAEDIKTTDTQPAVEYASPVDAETDEKAKEDGIMLISENPEAAAEAEVAVKDTCALFAGTVESAELVPATEEEAESYVLTLKQDDMLMAFSLLAQPIINQADLSYKKAADIKAGDFVSVVYDEAAPTTKSLPGMSTGAMAVVINAEAGAVTFGFFNEELTDAENTLKLNVGETTVITDLEGSKVAYSAEDLKNKELLVLHTISTMSIPAQTNPELVMIFPAHEVAPEVPAGPLEDVALRATAQEAGFRVVWIANDAPISVIKDEKIIEVTIGSDAIKVNGEEAKLPHAVALVDGVTMICGEFAEFLK